VKWVTVVFLVWARSNAYDRIRHEPGNRGCQEGR
jgi:hypothetical protein